VSPKRRVAVATGIFAALGIGVSFAIILISGGVCFTCGIPTPPGPQDIWVVGSSIRDGTVLKYSLDSIGTSSSLDSATVSMNFRESGDNWNVTFAITNGTNQEFTNAITMSKKLTREGQIDDSFMPYLEPIQSSIFAVRDMEYGNRDKYLVVGAPWNTIFYKASQVTVRVTDEEKIQTPAGSFDSFVLSYELGDKESRIWMVSHLPLPAKAEVYDTDDTLQYRFELLEVSGIDLRYFPADSAL
jgi:hypothetical protein